MRTPNLPSQGAAWTAHATETEHYVEPDFQYEFTVKVRDFLQATMNDLYQ